MILTDGKKTAMVEIRTWDGEQYGPDWSADFFGSSPLRYDYDLDAAIVDDVDYCIAQARDMRNAEGDYYDLRYDTPNWDPRDIWINWLYL